MKIVLLTALGVGGATIFGSLIGFVFRNISHKFSDIVLSFAAGVMLSAAVLGLILPSLNYGGTYGILVSIIGIFTGAVCLNLIDKLVPHLHRLVGTDTETHRSANLDKVLLFVTAIAIHNLPEGIAAGVSFGSEDTAQAMMIAGAPKMLPLRSKRGQARAARARSSLLVHTLIRVGCLLQAEGAIRPASITRASTSSSTGRSS